MWANHNAAGTHTPEDWRAVTRYWIDHYFCTEEYYQIDGRPVVMIWAPSNIRRDVGGSDKASRLYALSQTMARAAGLKGIYFIAMGAHETDVQVRELTREGYDAFTSYHGFIKAQRRAGNQPIRFEDVVATSPDL